MPAAIIGGGAVLGGLISAVGSNKAAKTQVAGADRASELQNQQYQQTRADQLAQLAQQRADQAPYQQAGYGALSQLVGGTTPGGSLVKPFSMQDYQEDPGYQFRLSQGEQGINRAATASGSRYSGATLKALSRFNSGLASQEYGNAYSRYQTDQGNQFNRLSSLAGTGQTSVAQAGQAGQNAYGNIANAGQANANAQGNALQNSAAARASGYVGVGNAINGTIGNLTNAYQQQQYLSGLNGSQPITQGATNQTGNFNYYGPGYSP